MAFSHNLLGEVVEPKPGLVESGRWKGKPNLSGQYFGTIRGVERENKSGLVSLVVLDPHGELFTVLMSEVLVPTNR